MVISRVAVIGATCALSLVVGEFAHAQQNSTVTYFYTDPQGTVLAETDAQGNIVARYDYAPYGNIALGTSPNGPGYTGHVGDHDTDLIYMQQRYYDPTTRRFLSVDPVSPTAANLFSFNRYDYANDNPVRYIDPDGRTCTEADKVYTCQIDQVVKQVNGKNVTSDATAEDHKTYAGLEKALTKAVNSAANSGKTSAISFRSGSKTYSFSISGASVAKNLATRAIRVNPSGFEAMYTQGNTTHVEKDGLQPGRTIFGDAERTQSAYFLHEGIHNSREETKALGMFGSWRMGRDQDAHQDAYNAAASSFLEPDQ